MNIKERDLLEGLKMKFTNCELREAIKIFEDELALSNIAISEGEEVDE